MAIPYLSQDIVDHVSWAMCFAVLKCHVLRGCGPGGHRNSKQSRRILGRMQYNQVQRKPWIPNEIRTLRTLREDLDRPSLTQGRCP